MDNPNDYSKGSIIFDQAVDIVRKWDEVNKNHVSPIGLMYVMRIGYGKAVSIINSLCENHIIRIELTKNDVGEDAIKYHIITKEELTKKFPDAQWYEPKHQSNFDYDLARETLG
jgi:hypothetical protein